VIFFVWGDTMSCRIPPDCHRDEMHRVSTASVIKLFTEHLEYSALLQGIAIADQVCRIPPNCRRDAMHRVSTASVVKLFTEIFWNIPTFSKASQSLNRFVESHPIVVGTRCIASLQRPWLDCLHQIFPNQIFQLYKAHLRNARNKNGG
jgi:hypothetical protein